MSASDPVHSVSAPGLHWTTANIGEAAPGVLTPLGWSLWGPATEQATRTAFHRVGAATRAEARLPAADDERFMRAFYGRGAAQVEFLARMGDRIPGTSGAAIAAQVFGAVPDGLAFTPTRRRYPVVAVRMPSAFLRMPGLLRAAALQTEHWWRDQVRQGPELDLDQALAQLAAGARRFQDNITLQASTLFCVVQPLYEVLDRLVRSLGLGDVTALAGGYGEVPEAEIVTGLWRASRGEVPLEDLLLRHGFHGAREGEIASRVWREEPASLVRLMGDYAARDDADDPRLRGAQLQQDRQELERQIVAAVPPARRASTRAILAMGRRMIPLRGVAKASYLQALDVARCGSRRAGALLARNGVIAEPDDVFYLTVEEILGRPSDAVRGVIGERRARHLEYESLHIPASWQGNPVPTPASATRGQGDGLTGVGVSPGIVEGIARVVRDPTTAEVVEGEILFAPATDPSWASIMFLASALVVDIGGALSHAAIVARELGIPCVMNTGVGTALIRSGDLCKVDGSTGVVTILSRKPATPRGGEA
ncbi:MAG TPA: PEP-utilizing enzyme [Sporichthyaceae bacterium]|nr:PEP-utilizing enzyme [Sporichthyaceae bacterium]